MIVPRKKETCKQANEASVQAKEMSREVKEAREI
jgi:hypothetical protein